jgi:nucleolin
MQSKLFVRNLSWSVTEDELSQLFAQLGSVVSIKIPINHQTGRSRGFAFVEMSTPEEAQQVITQFNDTVLHERPIMVMEQSEQAQKPQTAAPKNPKLFIKNICPTVTEDQVKALFEQAGQVVSIKIPLDQTTGQNRPFGFVEMATADEAEKAIETLNYTPLGQMEIVVQYQDPNFSKTKKSNGFSRNNPGGRDGWGGGDYNSGGDYDRNSYY